MELEVAFPVRPQRVAGKNKCLRASLETKLNLLLVRK
jgi:hypothetical protein